MSITLRITDAGRAALVNAAHDGTNAVRIVSAGVSPVAIVAAGNTATLPGEVKRIATVSGGAVAADVIHLIVRDESADTYTARSLALYLADGTLFASYGQPTPIIEKSSAALMLLAIDATLLDVAASQITFGNANFLNPPATTATAGVVELATEAEALALADAVRALTPKTMAAIFTAANVLSRLAQVDGAGSGLDADMLDGLQASDFIRRAAGTRPIDYDTDLGRLTISGQNGGWDMSYGFRDYLGTSLGGFGAAGGNGGINYYYVGPSGASTALRVYPDRVSWGTAALWHAGNDGAGSGLDADLLDGLQASDFLRRAVGTRPIDYDPEAGRLTISGQNGGWDMSYAFRDYLGTALGGFGAAGGNGGINYYYVGLSSGASGALRVYPDRVSWGANTLWHAANDGAGSGLDADLLDGLDASEFVRRNGAENVSLAIGRLISFYTQEYGIGTPDSAGLQLFCSPGDAIRFGRRTGTAFTELARLDGSNGTFSVGGYVPWSAVNDGAGSGLDADMVDGRHGSEFSRITASRNTANGYRVHDDGHKECWGSVDVPAGGSVDVALPVAHTSWCVPVGSGAGTIGVHSVNGAPPTSFTVRNAAAEALTFRWHSRGL
jgi:hypothetical protein